MSKYEYQLQVALGTFTYDYTELATSFSRWLEDALIVSVPATKRVRLFNRSAASAMDPAFREIYADFLRPIRLMPYFWVATLRKATVFGYGWT